MTVLKAGFPAPEARAPTKGYHHAGSPLVAPENGIQAFLNDFQWSRYPLVVHRLAP